MYIVCDIGDHSSLPTSAGIVLSLPQCKILKLQAGIVTVCVLKEQY